MMLANSERQVSSHCAPLRISQHGLVNTWAVWNWSQYWNTCTLLPQVEKYFLPCVLSHAAPKASVREEASSKVQPLFITFRCGYCPKGVFSALIVHLMSKHNNGGAKITWRLNEDGVSRDCVTFKVGREDNAVSITTHVTHLEVLVKSETHVSANLLQTSPHEICNSIRQCIDEGIVAVSQTLHYNCDSAFHYSFYCTHPSCTKTHDHLAVCHSEDPIVMECVTSKQSCDLPDNYRIWFGHPVSKYWCMTLTAAISSAVISTSRPNYLLCVSPCSWLKVQLLEDLRMTKHT